MSFLLGIDLGSTSLKVVIYALDGEAVASASTQTVLNHPDPAHREGPHAAPRHRARVYLGVLVLSDRAPGHGRRRLGRTLV